MSEIDLPPDEKPLPLLKRLANLLRGGDTAAAIRESL